MRRWPTFLIGKSIGVCCRPSLPESGFIPIPARSPEPSSVDEETFARVFGQTDWAVMFILAQEGTTYARLQFSAGPGGEMVVPVDVDYSQSFAASDELAWEDEYQASVSALEEPWFGFEEFRIKECIPVAEREPLIGRVRELMAVEDESDPFYYQEPWDAR